MPDKVYEFSREPQNAVQALPGGLVLSEMAHALASSSRDHGVEDVEPTPLLSSVSVSHGPTAAAILLGTCVVWLKSVKIVCDCSRRGEIPLW